MPKFAANLTMMFNEVSFLERFDAAAAAGFEAVEFLFPYDFEPQAIRDKLDANNLQLILHNLPAGDWGAGDRGNACDPARVGEFQQGVDRAIKYATALGCTRINCLAGKVSPDHQERARRTLVENLRYAAGRLKEAGITLLLEPINTRDIPGFFVSRSRQALEIIDDVGADNLKLQFDLYHAQVMEGDLTHTIETQFGRIAHLQLADNPGRHEPGTGEINYPFLFRRLDELKYEGWIGCEYKPLTTTTEGLGWFAPWRPGSRG